MDFYNDLITEKSWRTLQTLKNKLNFVLIGGWAVYLYTKALKSKDIDIIIDYDQLDKLRQDFTVSKNDRLKKYEGRREEVQIDIYLPFYSNLGIPVEEIIKEKKKVETFTVVSSEMLLILKQYTYGERKLSAKGQKDKLDILSLITKIPINWENYLFLLSCYQMTDFSSDLQQMLKSTTKVPELNFNKHVWSRLKRKIQSQISA